MEPGLTQFAQGWPHMSGPSFPLVPALYQSPLFPLSSLLVSPSQESLVSPQCGSPGTYAADR